MCLRKVLVSKIFLIKRGIRILSVFLSHTAQKLRGGTLLCFRNVPITKKFWIVGVSGFCLFFCLTVPKTFEDEPFCVSEILGYRKCFG